MGFISYVSEMGKRAYNFGTRNAKTALVVGTVTYIGLRLLGGVPGIDARLNNGERWFGEKTGYSVKMTTHDKEFRYLGHRGIDPLVIDTCFEGDPSEFFRYDPCPRERRVTFRVSDAPRSRKSVAELRQEVSEAFERPGDDWIIRDPLSNDHRRRGLDAFDDIYNGQVQWFISGAELIKVQSIPQVKTPPRGLGTVPLNP